MHDAELDCGFPARARQALTFAVVTVAKTRTAAGCWRPFRQRVRSSPVGTLAGGTTPFMRAYTTIWP